MSVTLTDKVSRHFPGRLKKKAGQPFDGSSSMSCTLNLSYLRFGVLLSLLFLLTACASTTAFVRADANGDGLISSAEAGAFEDLSVVFSSADANQDGFLSPPEYEFAVELIWRWRNPEGLPKDAWQKRGPAAGGGDGHGGHQH